MSSGGECACARIVAISYLVMTCCAEKWRMGGIATSCCDLTVAATWYGERTSARSARIGRQSRQVDRERTGQVTQHARNVLDAGRVASSPVVHLHGVAVRRLAKRVDEDIDGRLGVGLGFAVAVSVHSSGRVNLWTYRDRKSRMPADLQNGNAQDAALPARFETSKHRLLARQLALAIRVRRTCRRNWLVSGRRGVPIEDVVGRDVDQEEGVLRRAREGREEARNGDVEFLRRSRILWQRYAEPSARSGLGEEGEVLGPRRRLTASTTSGRRSAAQCTTTCGWSSSTRLLTAASSCRSSCVGPL